MATAPSPNDLTRQQLDELDALLQRMLALPLNNPDPAAPVAVAAPPAPPKIAPAPLRPDPRPVPAPNWRLDPPAAPAAAPHLVPQPVPPTAFVPEPEPEPEPAPVPPSVLTPAAAPVVEPPVAEAPPAPLPPLITAPEPAPEPPPAPSAPEPTFVFTAPKVTAPKPAAVLPPAPATDPGPPVSVVWWPLVAVNWVFDTVLGLFGPPGRLLRSGPLKYLYGLTGLGLLAYTGLKMAEARGWVSLPVPLPWPR